VRGDSTLARSVLAADDAVDDMRSHISAEIVQRLRKGPRFVKPWLDLLYITRCLRRIGHHATNVAEDVLFIGWIVWTFATVTGSRPVSAFRGPQMPRVDAPIRAGPRRCRASHLDGMTGLGASS
jgi:phosphate uptake regulator